MSRGTVERFVETEDPDKTKIKFPKPFMVLLSSDNVYVFKLYLFNHQFILVLVMAARIESLQVIFIHPKMKYQHES